MSSHLLSEMAVTANQLIVIGRGRLIADAATADFIAKSTESTVRVRSPQLPALAELLARQGMQATPADGALIVHNAPIERVGELAGGAGITLHELAALQGSLEEAFMQLTGDSVEYGGQRFSTGADPMAPAGQLPDGASPAFAGPTTSPSMTKSPATTISTTTAPSAGHDGNLR